MHRPHCAALSLLMFAVAIPSPSSSFTTTPKRSTIGSSPLSSSSLSFSSGTTRLFLTPLPKCINPLDRDASKGRDIQGDIRKLATTAIEKAFSNSNNNKPILLELEFPPLIGGERSKSQFDDFDNVQELNQNQDWCAQWLPTVASQAFNNGDQKDIWFILPDTKEVELCKEEWKGDRYLKSAVFSSIEAVAQHYSGGESGDGYSKPWGATIANAVNQLVKGSGGGDDENGEEQSQSTSTGLLGDARALDSLEASSASLHLVCQPGNGGPVEDWINVKKLHESAGSTTPTIVVNGALDKVRDGYYAPFIFPALAKTFDFYKSFEQLVYLKPVSDKGLYGWVFTVYGEPWQVVLQQPRKVSKGDATYFEVEDIVALVSETRPSYQECIQALIKCNSETSSD